MGKRYFGNMKYFSTFTGIGGFELGIQQSYEDYKNRTGKQQRKSVRNDIQRQGDSTDNLGLHSRICDWTSIGYSEINKYACQVYSKHLTTKIMVSPKTESECSLSDILEEQVDPKYFLKCRKRNYK